MKLKPISFRDAAKFINKYHRHHKSPYGWKFGVSIKASGFTPVAQVEKRSWSRPKRPRVDKTELVERVRWERSLS